MNLGLVARSLGDLESLQVSLTDSYGIQVYIATADISNKTEVDAMVNTLVQNLGSVDILINNAGIAQWYAS